MAPNDIIEAGHELIQNSDPASLSNALYNEIFPELTLEQIYDNYGRKWAVLYYQQQNKVNLWEASDMITQKFPKKA